MEIFSVLNERSPAGPLDTFGSATKLGFKGIKAAKLLLDFLEEFTGRSIVFFRLLQILPENTVQLVSI